MLGLKNPAPAFFNYNIISKKKVVVTTTYGLTNCINLCDEDFGLGIDPVDVGVKVVLVAGGLVEEGLAAGGLGEEGLVAGGGFTGGTDPPAEGGGVAATGVTEPESGEDGGKAAGPPSTSSTVARTVVPIRQP